MFVNVENLSAVKKKISIEIPAERVSREVESVYEKIRKNATVKGFRKGKVPQPVIEKYYSDQMEADVLKNLINESYFAALTDHKLLPVSKPDFESDPLVLGGSFKYSVTFETAPDIALQDYRGLAVEKRMYVPDEKVLDGRLKEIQDGMAQVKALEEVRPAAVGDFAVIDFKGFLAGVPFEHGAAEDYTLQLGSNHFIPGFEEQVVGMQPGERRDITVTFPAEYGSKDLAGKEVVFDVTLKELKVKELPVLDDDFARQLGAFDTLAALKNKLTDLFQQEEAQKIDAELRDAVVKALIAKHEVEVPEALVEKQQNVLVENMKHNLAAKNLNFAMIGTSEEKIREQSRDVAVSQVKGSLLLAAVAEKEIISVDEACLEEKVRDIAAQANKDFEVVMGFYNQNLYAKDTLVMQLREDKVIDFLLEQATVTEVARQAE
jgi:trigger factor